MECFFGMDLQEYEKVGYKKYKGFCELVRQILEKALDAENAAGTHKYNLQIIKCRAKSPNSLRSRLEEENKEKEENIEEIRRDLAGCRVVFVFDDDVEAFINSGILQNSFTFHSALSKNHVPSENAKSVNDLYKGDHYIVELKEENVPSPEEYERFKGLKCEIQVRTTLIDAYSEASHQIYKMPETEGYGTKRRQLITKRLKSIMTERIIPAGVELQKVYNDSIQLTESLEWYGRDLHRELSVCKDNNEIYDLLKKYSTLYLQNYDREFLEIKSFNALKALEFSISRSRDNQTFSIETPWGFLQGKTSFEVLKVSLEIFNYIRFVDIDKSFSFLIKLYYLFEDHEEKKEIIKSLNKLIEYNIDVLEQSGFYVQEIVINNFKKMSEDELLQVDDLIIETGNLILNSQCQSTGRTEEGMFFRKGVIPVNEDLVEIRLEMISLLKRIYSNTNDDPKKKSIISALQNAMSTQKEHNDALLNLVLRDSKNIIDFYSSIVANESYGILKTIESLICNVYNRLFAIRHGSAIENYDGRHYKSFMDAIQSFKNQLNKDSLFVIYKTFVGYESVFDMSWAESSPAYNEVDQYREQKINEYVLSINAENITFWEEMIVRCAQTPLTDGAQFIYFKKFLKSLARQNPEFVYYLLRKHELVLEHFFDSLFAGLLKSDHPKKLFTQIHEWVDAGEHLEYCARVFYKNPIQEELFAKIFVKAKEIGDVEALRSVIVSSLINQGSQTVNRFFLQSIQELTTLKDTGWTDFVYYQKEVNKISTLTLEDAIIVTNSLLPSPEINHQIEYILEPIAQTHPNLILEFFESRVILKKESMVLERYAPIPFGKFLKLGNPFSENPLQVLETVVNWKIIDGQSFRYSGAKLIHNIFPEFIECYQTALLELFNRNKDKNSSLIMDILYHYPSHSFKYKICREIINLLEENDPRLGKVKIILEREQGGFSQRGEHINFLEGVKKELKSWENDSSLKLKNVANSYSKELDNSIAQEREKITRQKAQNKLEFEDN